MDCGHHYHADERGWICCRCPSRVSKRRPAPTGRLEQCLRPSAWLSDASVALTAASDRFRVLVNRTVRRIPS